MFNAILVPIDRSVTNHKIFEEALYLAKATKAKLILLHVLSEQDPASPIMSLYPAVGDDYHYLHLPSELTHTAHQIYQQQWQAFEQEGLNILRSFADKAIAQGIPTEFKQVTGHPSSTICEIAQSCQADVIVMGRRGHSGLQEMLLGSVSNYVVHHAPCSVLLVQVPAKKEPLSTTITTDTKINS